MSYARRLLKFWLPHGLVELYRRHAPPRVGSDLYERAAARARRRVDGAAQAAAGASREFSYERGLRFLDGLGIDPSHTREGSMPLASLDFMHRHFDRLDGSRPLLALHIGNFLGVSLAYLAHAMSELHAGSKVVSIDPNLTHRGVARTMDTVLALLTHFGLEDRAAILTGYSLEKNVSNQGEVFGGYDPVANWKNERACTHQLDLLAALAPARFDLCLMDGNHEGDYLRRELDRVHRLLRPGGLLVLDDVSAGWPEIESVFRAIPADQFQRLGTDGRIGLLVRS